jgi:hypothetical protein
MMLDKCPNCGETAIVECAHCGHQSYCPNCGECGLNCGVNGRKKKGMHHITVRIDHELNKELDNIFQKSLKTNPFATKSDLIRELIKDSIERR